jgi:hypothetical protein
VPRFSVADPILILLFAGCLFCSRGKKRLFAEIESSLSSAELSFLLDNEKRSCREIRPLLVVSPLFLVLPLLRMR